MAVEAELPGLARVPVRKDPQQQICPRRRIVRALDDERWSPARVEALADVGLRLREVEALLVPLKHGVAPNAALVGTPAVFGRMLALADGRGAGVEQDPLVDVSILRLCALGIRFPVQLLA